MKGGNLMIKIQYKQLVLAGLLLASTIAGSIGVTRAMLRDEEVSSHTVSLGTVNLQVGDTDPIDLPIDLTNMSGSDTLTYEVDLKSDGSIPGNFSVLPVISNDSEGENPEGETNKEGDGEADTCVQLLLAVNAPGYDEQVLANDTLANLAEIELDDPDNTIVDEMVNSDGATLKIRAHSGLCGMHSMGDTVDLDLIFYLEESLL